MTDEHEPIEHELIRTGTLVDFEVYTAPDGEMRVKAEARLASELRHEH